MNKIQLNILIITLLYVSSYFNCSILPKNFTYLRELDPTIVQDIRFSKYYNILGRPLVGYEANECILTKNAASKLIEAQKETKKFSIYLSKFLTLKVYDCYRPKQANSELFYNIIEHKTILKPNFNPNLYELDVIKYGFVDLKSDFSRGSTVSVSLSYNSWTVYNKNKDNIKQINCNSEYTKRWMVDLDIDMGTNINCYDKNSFYNMTNDYTHTSNRKLLKSIMENNGFVLNKKGINWWEFTLKNEPYTDIEFDFPIKNIYYNSKKSPILYSLIYLNEKNQPFELFYEIN